MRAAVYLGLALILLGCKQEDRTIQCNLEGPSKQHLPLQVEVKDTDHGRETGLMYRKELAKDAGMLFVWPDVRQRFMWMKNTYIPLDMLFLYNKRIVGMIENTMPHSEAILTVESPANLVLELNAGSLKAWGVTELWRLDCKL